jgi:hypothetical protein
MPISYSRLTIDAPNPLARYAHRTRLRKSLALALPRIGTGKVLDYGCGSGAFISAVLGLKKDIVGYEPFMQERSVPGLPIYSRIEDVEALGPYTLVTLFETIEHLQDQEIDAFLHTCHDLLCSDGIILISAPIEIGPALLLKELNRYLRTPRPLRRECLEHSTSELLKASLFGVPPSRTRNVKASHKGFDFRRTVQHLEDRGWDVQMLSQSPLPIGTWYGNSQVFLSARCSSS